MYTGVSAPSIRSKGSMLNEESVDELCSRGGGEVSWTSWTNSVLDKASSRWAGGQGLKPFWVAQREMQDAIIRRME